MLIDHARELSPEPSSFEVCRLRQLPVVTFMNKLDRFGLDPLELLDDVSSTLNLKVVPMNWPIGMGSDFKGVVNLSTKRALLFNGGRHGTTQVETQEVDWDDCAELVGEALHEQVSEELELVEMAGDEYTREGFLNGEISPVFWGSAMNNFGVEPLLEFLTVHAAPPKSRQTIENEVIEPVSEQFTGFIFKIRPT